MTKYHIDICDPDTKEIVHTVGEPPIEVLAETPGDALLRYTRGCGYDEKKPFAWDLKARQVDGSI